MEARLAFDDNSLSHPSPGLCCGEDNNSITIITKYPNVRKSQAALAPVIMYYLERYFSDVPDKTETDMEIKSILDNSREGRDLLERALENFRKTPLEKKYETYDRQTLELTSSIEKPLNLDLIRNRLVELEPAFALDNSVTNTPTKSINPRLLEPPRVLALDNSETNASTYSINPELLESVKGFALDRSRVDPGLITKFFTSPPDSPSALAAKCVSKFANPDTAGSEQYLIELKWQDNSDNEEGFLIYRQFKKAESAIDSQSPPGGYLQLSGSVGRDVTTFVDSLTRPENKDDQYCYQVVAYNYGNINYENLSQRLESNPSNWACAYIHPIHTLPLGGFPDEDNDGVFDENDICPKVPGVLPSGCPDRDGDGYYDQVDACPDEFYDSNNGCPIKYNLRWMGMKFLSNSQPYYKWEDNMLKLVNGESQDAWSFGEEPYLVFSWTNGMLDLPGQGGMMIHDVSRWCCGEEVDVKSGNDYEPDEDYSGEEFPANLNDIRENGLTVFPAVTGKFSAIDGDLGLVLSTTLMERDWKAKVTLDEQANALEAALKVGGSIGSAIGTCAGTMGFGCFLGVGGAIKSIVETVLGLSKGPTTIMVDDPDDFQGTEVWRITRQEADFKTSGANNGAYAFWFDMPMTYKAGCWVNPCTVSTASETLTMRARLYFCLYREGTSKSSIKDACSSYEMISPWPMVP